MSRPPRIPLTEALHLAAPPSTGASPSQVQSTPPASTALPPLFSSGERRLELASQLGEVIYIADENFVSTSSSLAQPPPLQPSFEASSSSNRTVHPSSSTSPTSPHQNNFPSHAMSSSFPSREVGGRFASGFEAYSTASYGLNQPAKSNPSRPPPPLHSHSSPRLAYPDLQNHGQLPYSSSSSSSPRSPHLYSYASRPPMPSRSKTTDSVSRPRSSPNPSFSSHTSSSAIRRGRSSSASYNQAVFTPPYHPSHPSASPSTSTSHPARPSSSPNPVTTTTSFFLPELSTDLLTSPQPSSHAPRPPNSWILYRSDTLRKIQDAKARGEEFPSGNWNESLMGTAAQGASPSPRQGDVGRMIGALWRNESTEVRSRYDDLSKTKKEEHARLYPNYKYQPQRRNPVVAANFGSPFPTSRPFPPPSLSETVTTPIPDVLSSFSSSSTTPRPSSANRKVGNKEPQARNSPYARAESSMQPQPVDTSLLVQGWDGSESYTSEHHHQQPQPIYSNQPNHSPIYSNQPYEHSHIPPASGFLPSGHLPSSSSYDFAQPQPTTYDLSVYDNYSHPSSSHYTYYDHYRPNTGESSTTTTTTTSSSSSYHLPSPLYPRSPAGLNSPLGPNEDAQDPSDYAAAWSLLEEDLVNQPSEDASTSWVEGTWGLVEEGGRGRGGVGGDAETSIQGEGRRPSQLTIGELVRARWEQDRARYRGTEGGGDAHVDEEDVRRDDGREGEDAGRQFGGEEGGGQEGGESGWRWGW